MKEICYVHSCLRPVKAGELCAKHYERWRKTGDYLGLPTLMRGRKCTVYGCERKHMAKGLCCLHYRRLKIHGDLAATRVVGKRFKNKQGYVVCYAPDDPNAHKGGQVHEHVLIMAEYLERPLRPGETVHHRNGVRDDNRIENLELWTSSHPPGQRVEDLLNWARDILSVYADEPYLNTMANELDDDTHQTPLLAMATKGRL